MLIRFQERVAPATSRVPYALGQVFFQIRRADQRSSHFSPSLNSLRRATMRPRSMSDNYSYFRYIPKHYFYTPVQIKKGSFDDHPLENTKILRGMSRNTCRRKSIESASVCFNIKCSVAVVRSQGHFVLHTSPPKDRIPPITGSIFKHGYRAFKPGCRTDVWGTI